MTIERRMARSAAWMIALRLADRTIGLVSVLILARLLAPADFGLVAMGTVVLGALEAMTAFGFEMALIKRQAKDRPRLDSAWTLNVIIGALNGVLILALSPLAVAFYDEPRVVNVMLVLAAIALVGGFRNIGMVAFEQELRFGPIVMLALLRRVSGFVITLGMAWWHGTYWALLAGMFAGYAIDVLLSYQVSRYRPRFSLAAWADLFSFSKWLLVNNLFGYLSSRGGDLIVGGRAGAAALGTFTVSNEVANLPTTEMVWPVMRAVFPGYAALSSEPERLARGFLNVFSLVVLFTVPAAAGIALLAEPIVAVLLGAKWMEAVPLVQVLAIAGGVRAVQANAGSVYMALDRPQLAAGITLISIVVGLGSFGIALGRLPLAEAVWVFVGASAVVAAVNLTLVTRLLRLSWSHVLRAMARPAFGVAVMSLVLVPVRHEVWTGGQPAGLAALSLLALVLTGAALYLLAVLLAWRSAGRPDGSAEQAVVLAVSGFARRGKPA